VKSTVASAYPSKAEEPVRVITQMGISTGAVNTAWETIKAGKLVVDEGKLNEVVLANPEGVRDFFGSDTDGDAIIDNGMAYQLTNVLKPFIMAGKNILQAKIDFESYAIENNNERIERQNEHLKRYEDKLRRKFAAMEKSISGTKSQGDWLNNQMKGMQGQGK
jgi:flagellar hook-associated protein 2